MRTFLMSTAAALFLGGAGAAQADVTLLFWPGPESDAMQKVIDAFNDGPGAEHGFKVDQLLFSREGYFDKEIADLAAGSTEFDLALVTTYTLGRYAPFLEPLDQYLAPNVKDVFAAVALDSLSADGKVFGVPTDLSLHFLYYRKDLIDQLMSDQAWKDAYRRVTQEKMGMAMDPKAPEDWTWDDFVATALFFTQSINPDSPTQYGTALELKNLIFNIMIWQSTLVSNGGDWMDASGAVTIDSDAGKKGLETYQAIIDAGATPPGSLSYEYAEANAAFGGGNAATMLQWNAAFNTVNSPDEYPTTAGKVGIAPMPAGPEGHKTHVHSLGIGLNTASENKEQAGIFLGWLASEDAMKVYGAAGGTPPVPSVLEAMAGERPEFPLVGQYAADYGFVVNGGTAAQAVPTYEAIATAFSAVWSGQVSIEEGLAQAKAGMEAAMKAN
jgi:multiple sugar transport system substrate-binding protein